jgi:hypothetical protein
MQSLFFGRMTRIAHPLLYETNRLAWSAASATAYACECTTDQAHVFTRTNKVATLYCRTIGIRNKL